MPVSRDLIGEFHGPPMRMYVVLQARRGADKD